MYISKYIHAHMYVLYMYTYVCVCCLYIYWDSGEIGFHWNKFNSINQIISNSVSVCDGASWCLAPPHKITYAGAPAFQGTHLQQHPSCNRCHCHCLSADNRCKILEWECYYYLMEYTRKQKERLVKGKKVTTKFPYVYGNVSLALFCNKWPFFNLMQRYLKVYEHLAYYRTKTVYTSLENSLYFTNFQNKCTLD